MRRDINGLDEFSWLSGLGMMSTVFSLYSDDEEHTCSMRACPFERFVYVRRGEATFNVNGKAMLKAREKDIVYIKNNTSYISSWNAPSAHFVIDILHNPASPGEPGTEEDIRLIFHDKNGALDLSVCSLDEYDRTDPFFWIECSSIVLKFLSDLSRMRRDEPLERAGIYNAVTYLRNNYKCDISTTELAAMCSFSESQLRRLFKEKLGMSPTEYRNYLRLQKAESIMKLQGVSASKAAEIVGFSDANYFYRLQRKKRERDYEMS